MKKKILIAVAFIVVTSILGNVYAQVQVSDGQNLKTKSNIKNDLVIIVTIEPVNDGARVVFDHRLKTKDSSIKLTAGRMNPDITLSKDRDKTSPLFVVNARDNSVTEITGLEDMTSGMTRKKSMGMGKGIYSWIKVSFDKREIINPLPIEGGEIILPTDNEDGEYKLTLSWPWEPQQESGPKTCEVSFSVIKESGVYTNIKPWPAPTKPGAPVLNN